MGLTLTLAAWWMLRGRVHLAQLFLKGVGASAIVLAVLLLLFGAMAIALLATGLDPSAVLQFAPLGWALGGSLLASSTIVYARRHGWRTLRERFTTLQGHGRAVGFMWWLVLAACFSASSVIGARYFISDATGGVFSIPYRLLEWGVVDRIDGPVSDECLANRVVEYANHDPNGRRAAEELEVRGAAAVPGVIAKLRTLRNQWPPAPHTVTETGIATLLSFLKRHGETDEVHKWEATRWNHDLLDIEPSSSSWAP